VSEARPGQSRLYELCVPPFLEFARRHRGRRTTHQLENALRRFIAALVSGGITELESLTAQQIRDYLSTLHEFRPATIAIHASALREFLRYLRLRGVLEADLSHAVERPRLTRWSEPPRVLDPEAVERLLAAVDRSRGQGKRDYAMLLLAARYGLRSVDIRSLRFEDIRWREQRIVLLQSKTQRQLELPLLADVQDALVDYIRYGRPACAAREIFVRHLTPIGPLALRNTLGTTMVRALKAAGMDLRQPQRGMRVLRHSLATRMLTNGVTLKTIADVLGHGSIESTRRYTQVDLAGLRSVALTEAEVRR
jgi:site-specific recombinase XerD